MVSTRPMVSIRLTDSRTNSYAPPDAYCIAVIGGADQLRRGRRAAGSKRCAGSTPSSACLSPRRRRSTSATGSSSSAPSPTSATSCATVWCACACAPTHRVQRLVETCQQVLQADVLPSSLASSICGRLQFTTSWSFCSVFKATYPPIPQPLGFLPPLLSRCSVTLQAHLSATGRPAIARRRHRWRAHKVAPPISAGWGDASLPAPFEVAQVA